MIITYSYDSTNERCVVPNYVSSSSLSATVLANNYVTEAVDTAKVFMYMADTVAPGKLSDTMSYPS